MLRLLLLRHAKSSWSDPGVADIDRALSPRGRKAAAAMAKAIAARDLTPDRVLCSPARRARETLGALLPELGDEGRIAVIDALYQPPGGDYLGIVKEHGARAGTLMVIGHNPAIQATAVRLIGGGEPGLAQEISAKYPTAGLAVIDFDTDDWAAVSPHSGHVSAFIKPRDLEDGGDGEDPNQD